MKVKTIERNKQMQRDREAGMSVKEMERRVEPMESKWITHTADDEEPDCQKCDHISNNFDCSRKCGPNRGWKGYSREGKVDRDD